MSHKNKLQNLEGVLVKHRLTVLTADNSYLTIYISHKPGGNTYISHKYLISIINIIFLYLVLVNT